MSGQLALLSTGHPACPCRAEALPGMTLPLPPGALGVCGAAYRPAQTFPLSLGDGRVEQRPGAWLRCDRGHEWRRDDAAEGR
jgi:hypothetical protein